MSSEDVWYFLRGEEQVGPFSKDIIRQIHQGGQLPLETMVWREGMANWEPAGSVAELDLASAAATAPSPTSDSPAPAQAAATTAPAPALGQGIPAAGEGEAPRLRLRVPGLPTPGSADAPPPSVFATAAAAPKPSAPSPSIPAPSIPAPAAPAPSASSGHGLKVKDVERRELKPEDSPNVVAGQTPLKRRISYLTSSLFITPLFIIVSSIFFIMFQTEFPNPFGFKWVVAAFTVLGAVSIVGIRTFDNIFRVVALYFILPPIVLFWPVIMGTASITDIPGTHWFFSAFCLLYCMTIRIGLRGFIPHGLDKFAILTGLLVLASIFSVGMGTWKPEGWDSFSQEGGNLRLPARWARLMGQPDWGSDTGKVYFRIADTPTQHTVEKAFITRPDVRTGVLNVQLVDGNIFYVKFEFSAHEGYDINKLTTKNWYVYFKKEAYDEMDDSGAGPLKIDGEIINVIEGKFHLTERKNNVWKGTMLFKIEKSNPRAPDRMKGSFIFTVDEGGDIVVMPAKD